MDIGKEVREVEFQPVPVAEPVREPNLPPMPAIPEPAQEPVDVPG